MIKTIKKIPKPEILKEEIKLPLHLKKIKDGRDEELKNIITGKSNKFLLIIGPCSADDPKALLDYVTRLSKIQEEVKEKLFLVPRVYTNKPRTNGKGYKGMLHQPDPSGKSDILEGIRSIRKMHIQAIEASHLTSADEMLYPENFAYMEDLLSYHAIGARSVENQSHRLVSSGVDAPVGMKNPTSGDLSVMFNSIIAAQSGHTFLYREEEVKTNGNPLAHG
ncbi:MAG: 3-deoxy-7-phosphoheptulonate synthase, partial [Lachnospirales bacterium]